MPIRRSLARAAAASLCVALVACRRDVPAGAAPPPPVTLPQVDGTLTVSGLSAPVTIVRDRAGVPHITAQSQDDLFFAQGFVQAQDRLFQMDLWRRSVQGRLAEVLGANFIERDAMTRRVQYRGALDPEWTSYGPDVKAIATAFTRGINAWIAHAGDRLPEQFALAGWKPEPWRADDLLNRTDAFLASGNAQDEILRVRLVAAVGVATADALWPQGSARTIVPAGLDPGAINYTLGELLKRVGAPPYFAGFAAPFRSAPPVPADGERSRSGSNAWALSGDLTITGAPMVAGDPHRPLTSPSLRYLVHLTAPGWDVVGATAPWLPGVALGHNAQVAWSMAASNADTQDLYVERLNPANERQVQDAGRWVDMQVEHDAIAVKGRREPFEYDRLYTRHGVVVGIDRERHLAFTLRWSGSEPGAAGELAAVALDRAQSASDFRRALARWKMPVVDVVFADRGGVVGQEVAGLVPRRAPGAGFVPAAGWNRSAEWSGWAGSIARPSGAGTRPAFVVSANDSLARTSRIREQLAAAGQQPSALRVDVDAMKRLQHDVHAWNADRLVPMLQLVRGRSDRAEVLRSAILAWNREMDAASNAATMYASWEAALRRLLLAQRVPADLRVELSPRLGSIASTVGIPTRTWFDGDVAEARDALLIDALEAAVEEGGGRADTLAWGVAHTATFTHTLAVEERSRLRFNVGPFPAPGYADTVFAATQTAGPALQLIFDVGDWDRSVAASAPGQSEWPDSPHFADLAKAWAAAEYVPLPFTEPAVRSAAASTLTLRPTQP